MQQKSAGNSQKITTKKKKQKKTTKQQSVIISAYSNCNYLYIQIKNLSISVHNAKCDGSPHSFMEIDREVFSWVILSLPLIQEGQLSVSGKRNVHNTDKPLRGLSLSSKSVVR